MRGNKVAAIMLAAGMLMGSGALPAYAAEDTAVTAQAEQVGDSARVNSKFAYKITGKKTVAITGFKKKAINKKGMLVIPSKIGKRRVTMLDGSMYNDFYNYSKLVKAVKIPASVKKIKGDITPRSYWQDGYTYPVGDRCNNIRFYVTHGSAAEKYAARNGYKMKLYGDKNHVSVPVVNKNVGTNGMDVILSWDKDPKAAGYEVYRANGRINSFWDKVADVKDPQCAVAIAEGSTSFFKVRAYGTINGKKETSCFSAVKSFKKGTGDELKLKEVSRYRDSDENGKHLGFRFTYEKPERYAILFAQIKDPYDGKWYDLGPFFSDDEEHRNYSFSEGEMYVSFTGYYKKGSNGKTYREGLEKGVKYPVRIGHAVEIDDVVDPTKDIYSNVICCHWQFANDYKTYEVVYE